MWNFKFSFKSSSTIHAPTSFMNVSLRLKAKVVHWNFFWCFWCQVQWNLLDNKFVSKSVPNHNLLPKNLSFRSISNFIRNQFQANLILLLNLWCYYIEPFLLSQLVQKYTAVIIRVSEAYQTKVTSIFRKDLLEMKVNFWLFFLQSHETLLSVKKKKLTRPVSLIVLEKVIRKIRIITAVSFFWIITQLIIRM